MRLLKSFESTFLCLYLKFGFGWRYFLVHFTMFGPLIHFNQGLT
jgi:hypothetical protein